MQVCVDLEFPLIGKICYNNWTIYILYNCSIDLVKQYLKEIDCPFSILDKIESTDNLGFTYSNYSLKNSIISIKYTNSISDFINTLSHECTHLVFHINQYIFKEDIAIQIGDLSQIIFELFSTNK